MVARAAILIVPRSHPQLCLYISVHRAFLIRDVERGQNVLAFDELDAVPEATAVELESISLRICGPPDDRCFLFINSSRISRLRLRSVVARAHQPRAWTSIMRDNRCVP
jgi:hypothetical protein